MNKEEKEKMYDEWNHFLTCLNFAKSPLDARAIRFMNEFKSYMK